MTSATEADSRHRQLLREAHLDRIRLEGGEMSPSETIRYFQALVDAGLVRAMGREYERRVEWLAGVGLVRRRRS